MAPYCKNNDPVVILFYSCLTLLCETFFFGIFCVLMIPWVLIDVRRRKRSAPRRHPHLLLYCVLVEFTLSATFWATGVVIIILQFQWTVTDSAAGLVTGVRLENIRILANAIILVNYVITDGVLVQRARSLCRGLGESRYMSVTWYMRIPQASLVITAVSVVVTIVLRATATALNLSGGTHPDVIERALNYSQVAGLGFSLITNISAMAPIVVLALRYREQVAKSLQGVRGLQNVLVVLVESGALYCFVSIISIPMAFIHLPCGTLGDLFLQAGAQLAGIYVALVIVAVAVSQGELSGGSECTSDRTAITSHMVFGRTPACGSTHGEERSISSCLTDKGGQQGENGDGPSHD